MIEVEDTVRALEVVRHSVCRIRLAVGVVGENAIQQSGIVISLFAMKVTKEETFDRDFKAFRNRNLSILSFHTVWVQYRPTEVFLDCIFDIQ